MRNVTILLAVLAMFAATSGAAVTLYEGFDYTAGQSLIGQGDWVASSWGTHADFEVDVVSGSLSPNASPLTSTGNFAQRTAQYGSVKRATTASINFSQDGTHYVSALLQKSNVNNSMLMRVGDLDAGGAYFEFEYGANSSWVWHTARAGDGSASAAAPVYIAQPTYTYDQAMFFVAKIDTVASGSDTVSISIYSPGDTVPGTEPTSWDATASAAISGQTSGLSMYLGSSCTHSADEIRLGETWNDVAVPEPATMVLLGIGGIGVLIRRKRR